MENIQGYTVTNNNGSRSQRASVTVKNQYGQVAARLHSDKGRLLQRIRRELNSPERHELVSQLTQAGVPQGTIEEIVSLRAPLAPTSQVVSLKGK